MRSLIRDTSEAEFLLYFKMKIYKNIITMHQNELRYINISINTKAYFILNLKRIQLLLMQIICSPGQYIDTITPCIYVTLICNLMGIKNIYNFLCCIRFSDFIESMSIIEPRRKFAL